MAVINLTSEEFADRILPGQLDRKTGNGSRQRHSQGAELRAVAGHRQSQQRGNQGSHEQRTEENAGF